MGHIDTDAVSAMEPFITHLAGSFYRHLCHELQRPADLLDTTNMIDPGGPTPRQIILRVHDEMVAYMPQVQGWQGEFNLLRELNRRSGRDTYEFSTFEVFDRYFWEAIKDMCEQTPQSRERYRLAMVGIMTQIDVEAFGLNAQLLLRMSTLLKEIMREMIDPLYEDGARKAQVWAFVNDQMIAYQGWLIAYFQTILQEAWEQSERLLHNILPREICGELKRNRKIVPIHVEEGSVLFTDFAGFTPLTERMPPHRLVEELDICFSQFDAIVRRHNLEKIKTLGDGYMVAGSVPTTSATHLHDICLAALEMRDAITTLAEERRFACGGYWQVRIGIHTGPFVAGVIGEHKFTYDVWGDTVNVASRMESAGVAVEINISKVVKEAIDGRFVTRARGKVAVKGKGEMEMFLLTGVRSEDQSRVCKAGAVR